jgi:uncharacterized protein
LSSNVPGKKIFSETIEFHGHRNIQGTHRNTLEVTKESEISRRADCIIGVEASKSCVDLDERIANHLKTNGKMEFRITVDSLQSSFSGFGCHKLPLTDEREIVLRRSDFISERTLAIHCDAAAIDLPREIIRLLQNPKTTGTLELIAIEATISDNEQPSGEALDLLTKS